MTIQSYFVEEIPRRKSIQMRLKGEVALASTPARMSQLLSCSGADQGQVDISVDPQLL